MAKICITCSVGGHLVEILNIIDAFKDHEIFYITSYEATTKDLDRVYYLDYTDASPICLKMFRAFILAFYQSLKILYKEKPEYIVTTGSGIAIPVCYVGKLFGAKIVFVETLCRISTTSITGKALYPIADLFLVQWEYLTKKYGKKAKYWGKVI